MTPIDMTRCLVGDLYPLTFNARSLGKLCFDNTCKFHPLAKVGDAYPVSTMPEITQPFRWQIVPLLNNDVLVSCTYPGTQRVYLLEYVTIGNERFICTRETPIPAYCEEVRPSYIFKANYVEGSPLFIQMKFQNKYVSAMSSVDQDTIDRLPSPKMIPVRIQWDESQIRQPIVEGECTWYLNMDDAKTGKNALNGFTNLKPFEALTRRFRMDINESFLQSLK